MCWKEKSLVCQPVNAAKDSRLGELQCEGPDAGGCHSDACVPGLPCATPFKNTTRLLESFSVYSAWRPSALNVLGVFIFEGFSWSGAG